MRLRVTVRKARGLIWLMNVGAIFCLCLVFFTIYNKARADEFRTRSSRFFRDRLLCLVSEEKKKNVDPVFTDYSSLWEVSIDGSRPEKTGSDTGKDRPPDPGRDPLCQVIEVTIIVKVPRACKTGLARVKYLKGTDEPRELFREYFVERGDPLKPPYDAEPYFGKVLEIDPGRILFSWLGEEVEMALGGGESGANGALGAAAARSPVKEYLGRPPEETVLIEEDTWALSRQEYHEIIRNHEKILEQVNVTEIRNPETGKKTIELTSVEKDSLAYKRGLRQGDRLKSINGFPVSTKAGAVNYVDSNPDLGIYVLEVERVGRSVFLTYVYGE